MANTNQPGDINSLSVETLIDFYEQMFTIRKFEETVYEVYSRGIMPGLAHLYTGEEAIAVGVCAALEKEDNITMGWIGAHGSIHYLKKMKPIFETLGKRNDRLRLKIVCDTFFDCEKIDLGRNLSTS